MRFMLVSEELPPIFRLITKLIPASVTHVSFIAWYEEKFISKFDKSSLILGDPGAAS